MSFLSMLSPVLFSMFYKAFSPGVLTACMYCSLEGTFTERAEGRSYVFGLGRCRIIYFAVGLQPRGPLVMG